MVELGVPAVPSGNSSPTRKLAFLIVSPPISNVSNRAIHDGIGFAASPVISPAGGAFGPSDSTPASRAASGLTKENADPDTSLAFVDLPLILTSRTSDRLTGDNGLTWQKHPALGRG